MLDGIAQWERSVEVTRVSLRRSHDSSGPAAYCYAPPMSTPQELLDRLRAKPDDHASRLVYADWLMAQGDPRGDFIAAQSRLAELDLLDADLPALEAQSQRLHSQHGAEWAAPFSGARTHFAAGLIQRVAGTFETLEAGLPILEAREPVFGAELDLHEHIPDEWRDWARPKHWRHLKATPTEWFTAISVSHMLDWDLRALTHLDLSRCSVGADGCRLIAGVEPPLLAQVYEDWTAPPPLRPGQLQSLVLDGCGVGAEGVQVLTEAPPLEALEVLNLRQCRIEDASALHALRAWPSFTRLRELSLAGNKALAGSLEGLGPVGHLQSLALPQTVTPADFAALFPEPSAALRELNLVSARALLASPQLVAKAATHLTRLDLGSTRLGDDRFAVLLAAPALAPLMHLKLNQCSLSDRSVAELVAAGLDRLVSLDLSSNKLTDNTLIWLAAWPGLKGLSSLRLSNNRKLSAKGYQALIEAPGFDPAILDVGKCGAAGDALRERFGSALKAG